MRIKGKPFNEILKKLFLVYKHKNFFFLKKFRRIIFKLLS